MYDGGQQGRGDGRWAGGCSQVTDHKEKKYPHSVPVFPVFWYETKGYRLRNRIAEYGSWFYVFRVSHASGLWTGVYDVHLVRPLVIAYFVYKDAKEQNMSAPLWFILVILPMVGFLLAVLYVIIREVRCRLKQRTLLLVS